MKFLLYTVKKVWRNKMLCFIRHLKTIANMNNIISGRSEFDVLPNQKIFIDNELQLKEVIIYSSSSQRCVDTTNQLCELLSVNNVYFSECLLERYLGILEQTEKDFAKSQYPSWFYDGKIRVDIEIPNAEKIENVISRVDLLVNQMIDLSRNNDIIVCSHNQTLKIMYAIINNIDITNEYWTSFDFNNGEIVKII